MNKLVEFFRALLAVIVGIAFVIPFLLIIVVFLTIIYIFEKLFFGSNYSIIIAKYFGDDGTELLKYIRGKQ